MKVKITILAISLLLIAALSIGCGKLSIPTGDGGTISVSKDGGLTVKGKDGEASFSSDQKIPKDFPKEIPIPKGSKVEGSFQAKSDGKKSFTVTLSAKQSVEELVELYEDYLDKSGYEDVSGWGDNSFWSTTGYKTDYYFSAMISEVENEGSSVILTYSPK